MSMMSKYLKEKQRAEADKVIRDTVIREFDKFCDRANVVILFTLYKKFGFGKIRLERFYNEFKKSYAEMKERYSTDGDDFHYIAMKMMLQDAGVDYEELTKGDELQ